MWSPRGRGARQRRSLWTEDCGTGSLLRESGEQWSSDVPIKRVNHKGNDASDTSFKQCHDILMIKVLLGFGFREARKLKFQELLHLEFLARMRTRVSAATHIHDPKNKLQKTFNQTFREKKKSSSLHNSKSKLSTMEQDFACQRSHTVVNVFPAWLPGVQPSLHIPLFKVGPPFYFWGPQSQPACLP